MPSSEELVSVVIPAYNSESTLAETIESVRAQTYQNLEILVVDDGSADKTRAVAEEKAAEDERIRIIAQANGGVARARNRGIEEASADFIAPLDADDLWRSTKIERQLRALRAGGPEVGLVYCWSAVIDEDSRITSRVHPPYAGDVLPHLFYGNFVGNGSSALMRKAHVVEVGGYDSSLKERRSQGCEDWKLYLLLAERCHFAVVPDHLVGYRYTRTAMSGDVAQMLRSDAIVRSEMLKRHPEYESELTWGRRDFLNWLLYREMENQNKANVRFLLQEMKSQSRRAKSAVRAGKVAVHLLRKKIRQRGSQSISQPFLGGQAARQLD